MEDGLHLVCMVDGLSLTNNSIPSHSQLLFINFIVKFDTDMVRCERIIFFFEFLIMDRFRDSGAGKTLLYGSGLAPDGKTMAYCTFNDYTLTVSHLDDNRTWPEIYPIPA